MKEPSIEEFLRENKPVVPDDPTFILETRRRMAEVEGIKGEVDRQRRYGRTVLISTLVVGVVIGALATALAFLFPIEPARLTGESFWEGVRLFLDGWKYILMPAVAVSAILLGLLLARDRRSAELL